MWTQNFPLALIKQCVKRLNKFWCVHMRDHNRQSQNACNKPFCKKNCVKTSLIPSLRKQEHPVLEYVRLPFCNFVNFKKRFYGFDMPNFLCGGVAMCSKTHTSEFHRLNTSMFRHWLTQSFQSSVSSARLHDMMRSKQT